MNFYSFSDGREHHATLKKFLLVMKLTIILIVAALLQVHAASLAQTVTLNKRNIPLSQVFKEIKKQTGYDFLYSPEMMEQAKPVTIEVTNASLETVLKDCFADQPLTYTIDQKTIIVRKKVVVIREIPASSQIPLDVIGRVLDEQGHPIPGATIRVKNGKQATITDAKGVFLLKALPSDAIIMISVIGYDKKEIVAKDNMGDIHLTVASSKLDEVQVIAYGETSDRLSTGDITTVNAKTIEQQPVNNPLLALEGQVPGLLITQAAGVPGASVSVLIQGQNSLGQGNDPFYVIDGVPYPSQLLPNLGSSILRQPFKYNNSSSGNPLSYINPSDIESISVLKDAAATSIYGSQAANGAIIITTKKGKAGETQVNFTIQDGWGQVADKMQLLNTQQYLQMRNQALHNDGTTPSLQNGDYDLLLWDTTRYTDWQKKLIGNTAQYGDIDASVSGGNNGTQYLVSAADHRETSVFPGDFADNKVSLHFNLNTASANQKFHLQFSGGYMVDNNQLPSADLTSYAIQLAPDAPPLYNKDGTLNWEPNATGASTWENPLATLLSTYQNRTNNLTSNALLSYKILPGFDVKSSFGYTNLNSTELIVNPLGIYAPQYRPNVQSTGNYGYNTQNSWIIEPQASYGKSIGKGKLEALLGSTIRRSNSNSQQFVGQGFTSDALIPDISAAESVQSQQTTIATYKYAALFSRLSYNWDDKYLIELTGRRDGSSRFGSANEFHTFGAVGTGWIFSDEGFVKKDLPALSFGKIRASYGSTGSDQIGNYQFLSLYNPLYSDIPYQGIKGLSPSGLANPDLQWELTKKLELALELGFLKDRILLNSTWFLNRTSNELIFYNLPPTTGFINIAENLPATVQNSGWEFTVHSINIKSENFTWSTSLNLTIPQNKLIAFPGNTGYQYVVGQPVSIQKVFHLLGVDPATGIYVFEDSHGNPTFNPSYSSDNFALVNTDPKFYGGFTNDFQYKTFSLDVTFQFVKQIGFNYTGNTPGYSGYNQPVTVLNAWNQPGDVTTVQKYSSSNNALNGFYNEQYSDAAYSDASYIRMKNLSINWRIPDTWSKKLLIKNSSIFIRGQNLITITHYKGLDPETLNSTSLPPLKVLTIGIKGQF